VTVQGEVVGKIGRGLVVLVGISGTDTDKDADAMYPPLLPFSPSPLLLLFLLVFFLVASWIGLLRITKMLNARLWPEEGREWAKSVSDLGYELLLVSQFTLYGSLQKGPSLLFFLLFRLSLPPSLPPPSLLSPLPPFPPSLLLPFLGRKPDFHAAMSPASARNFYDEFVAKVQKQYNPDKVQRAPYLRSSSSSSSSSSASSVLIFSSLFLSFFSSLPSLSSDHIPTHLLPLQRVASAR